MREVLIRPLSARSALLLARVPAHFFQLCAFQDKTGGSDRFPDMSYDFGSQGLILSHFHISRSKTGMFSVGPFSGAPVVESRETERSFEAMESQCRHRGQQEINRAYDQKDFRIFEGFGGDDLPFAREFDAGDHVGEG